MFQTFTAECTHAGGLPTGLTPAEQQFLALALKTYRGTKSDRRKKLRQSLKEFGSA